MKKAIRGGRVLIDWSQNNGAKTTIAPVLAARTRAPERRRAAHVGGARRPGPAHSCRSKRCSSASRRSATRSRRSAIHAGGRDAPTTARSARYIAKRTAGKTPEPVPSNPAAAATPAGELPIFVIQEHHATALHWDFRLERDGVLVSWAVPRGVPHSYKRNNLAIMTEDHPMDYATFEGTIPAGEYGGGSVTIWDDGRYELEKWRDDEVIVTARRAPRRSARPRAARADPHRRRGREVDLAAAPHEDRRRRAACSPTACRSSRPRRRTDRRRGARRARRVPAETGGDDPRLEPKAACARRRRLLRTPAPTARVAADGRRRAAADAVDRRDAGARQARGAPVGRPGWAEAKWDGIRAIGVWDGSDCASSPAAATTSREVPRGDARSTPGSATNRRSSTARSSRSTSGVGRAFRCCRRA